MIRTSAPAQVAGSARSALGTPRKVASGPYIPPIRAMTPPEIAGHVSMLPAPGEMPGATGAAPGIPPAAGPGLPGPDQDPRRGRGLVLAGGDRGEDAGERRREPP